MTCGGSLPPFRLAPLPVTSTASSTASRGTQDASTPREIHSLNRSATLPVCFITRDHAGSQAQHPAAARPGQNQDQLTLSGIVSRLRDLLMLRHRVVHTGHMPSSKEATAAREAYYGLRRHLR